MNPTIRRRALEHCLAVKFKGERSALIARSGVTEGRISQMLADGFGERAARKLESALGLKEGYFEQEHDRASPPRTALNDEPAPYLQEVELGARIPLISWVAAGSWSEASDPYAPGAAEDWLSVPGDHSRSAIALRVRGDSMEPRFPDGCIVIVEPHRKPVSGNFVVVRNNDWDEATFKQYVVDGGIKLLRPLNAQYPTLQIGPGTVLVGVVVRKIIDEAV